MKILEYICIEIFVVATKISIWRRQRGRKHVYLQLSLYTQIPAPKHYAKTQGPKQNAKTQAQKQYMKIQAPKQTVNMTM